MVISENETDQKRTFWSGDEKLTNVGRIPRNFKIFIWKPRLTFFRKKTKMKISKFLEIEPTPSESGMKTMVR